MGTIIQREKNLNTDLENMDGLSHVAIIMDGNRRWASNRGLPKFEGHRHGATTLKRIIHALAVRDISVATFFVFSRENWRRTQEEVSWLMGLFREFLRESGEWLEKQGVRVRISGRVEDFPKDLQAATRAILEKTKTNQGMTVNLALSYGGREEIVQMVQRIAADTNKNATAISAIDEKTVERYLYTAGLPDVDLLIRTAGEQRLSGFLPWQAVYAELYFTKTLWPDFDEHELDHALNDFSSRKRNFGA